MDFIEAVRWVKQHLPGALTSGGISNLSFAFRGNNTVREAMHAVFLYHAIAAGLDMGIVNPGMLRIYDEIEPELLRCTEDVILDRDPEATERLIALASELAAQRSDGNYISAGSAEKPISAPSSTTLPVSERLARALVSGGSPQLKEDLLACLQEKGRAVDVIEGPLMAGMARVGELFGAGKMFLPQVVKSAKVMRDAVDILQPYMGEEGEDSAKPRFLLATVKGDVHDIGKNITGIVLRCNGFEVTDLGVMVPKETILEQAAAIGADLIGVSGLITPSLFQMEELCREMAARGLSTPLLIGGATTSALHTAVKLAPLYGHVFYAPDASASAVLAGRLMSDRAQAEADEHRKQDEIRALYEKKDQPAAPVADASPAAFPADTYLRGKTFADIPCRELTIGEVLPYFDWKLFYAIWGVRSFDSNESAVQLNADAVGRLDALKRDGGCRIRIAARFDACRAEGDEIVARAADGGEAWRLPMLRQAGDEGRSLADFVAPQAYGFDSPAGMFAISVHRVAVHADQRSEAAGPQYRPGDHPAGCNCAACAMDYASLLDRSLRLTLAEAASGWLDAELEKQLPQGSTARIVKPAAGYASCPDHSLKRDILALLPDGAGLDIRLTESCAMIPDATICGLVFAHPAASYPEIRRLDPATLDAYAARRGFSPDEQRQFLGHLQ